jgi:hypothetical protein
MGAEMMILAGKGRNYIIPSLDPLVINKHAGANRVGRSAPALLQSPVAVTTLYILSGTSASWRRATRDLTGMEPSPTVFEN